MNCLRILFVFLFFAPLVGLAESHHLTDVKSIQSSTITLKQLVLGETKTIKYSCHTLVENTGAFTAARPPVIEKYQRTILAQNDDFAKAMYIASLQKEFKTDVTGFDVNCSPVSVSANHNAKSATKYFAPELL